MAPLKSTNKNDGGPPKRPNVLEALLQGWQCWALRNPRNIFSRMFLPFVAWVDGIVANKSTYLDRKRSRFGNNFCAAGTVVLGDFDDVERALTSPQARRNILGSSYMDPDHLPDIPDGGRLVFLLALSDKEAGGNGDREGFRQCLEDYLTNERSHERAKDETSARLLEELAKHYKYMNHQPDGEFFTSERKGLKPFLVRYIHYTLFGLDPDDKVTMDKLMELHFTTNHAAYYLAKIGNFLNLCGSGRKWPRLIHEVADIYKASPAFQGFTVESKYNHMTLNEFSMLVTAIVGIAALLGPYHLAKTAMGNGNGDDGFLPDYEDHNTHKIDVRKIWDKLDLDDRDEVQKYLLECGRLWMPVSTSHHVATEPFTATIRGKEHTFPAGTLMLIPMIMAMLSEKFWGKDTYEFDHKRENLCPYSMVFHSVGERSHGRICPGKSLAMTMLTDALIVCGKVRRSIPVNKDYFVGMDRYTRTLIRKLLPMLNDCDPITDHQLAQPNGEGRQRTNVIRSGDVAFINHKKDQSFGRFPPGAWLGLYTLRRDLLFPVEDSYEEIAEEDVPGLLHYTKLGEFVPKPNVDFLDPQSDAGLTRQAFYGLGAHRVTTVGESQSGAPTNAVFMVDLMSMADFDVRSGFAKYGACVYFDANQAPLAIRNATGVLVKPGDGRQWEEAKALWRTSLLSFVTVVDHLYHVHFFVAAQMLRACVEGLPTEHPLRRAMHPFLMRTALINNSAAYSLLLDNSFIEHMTAFTEDALHLLAVATYKKGPEWKPLPEHVASKGPAVQKLIKAGRLPFYEDGLELWHSYRSFYDKVLDTNETAVQSDKHLGKFWTLLLTFTEAEDLQVTLTRDGLLNALANFSFHVSAQHEQVGSISDSMETPLHGGFRLMPGKLRVDKQSYVIGLALLGLTSLRTPPLLSKFENYWKTDEEKQHWESLQLELKALSKRVDTRNTTRRFAVQNVNPSILECSVSI